MPKRWLALDEGMRIELVAGFHEHAGIALPNVKVHATLHAVVENQIALGDETPVRLKVQHLMAQGLDRHDAIHAVISVLVKYVFAAMQAGQPSATRTERYYAALEAAQCAEVAAIGVTGRSEPAVTGLRREPLPGPAPNDSTAPPAGRQARPSHTTDGQPGW